MSLRNLAVLILIALFTSSLSAPAFAGVWDRNTVPALGLLNITVYRSPSCGCCHLWVEHLQKHGFQIKEVKTDQVESIKHQVGLPSSLASCHTAIASGYVIEGHVPADDIKHFLQAKPNAAGLAVPQMPAGSPGMEGGDHQDSFSVLMFNRNGKANVFNTYQF